jgi:hypothetical protein
VDDFDVFVLAFAGVFDPQFVTVDARATEFARRRASAWQVVQQQVVLVVASRFERDFDVTRLIRAAAHRLNTEDQVDRFVSRLIFFDVAKPGQLTRLADAVIYPRMVRHYDAFDRDATIAFDVSFPFVVTAAHRRFDAEDMATELDFTFYVDQTAFFSDPVAAERLSNSVGV